MPSIQNIEAFLKVAEGRSLVEIAEDMHPTVFAISGGVQALQSSIGIPLVTRAGGHLSLNHPDRLLRPLKKRPYGSCQPISAGRSPP